jgi:vinculin
MFTVTTKQILSPLADAVSQLIVNVSECEINNTAMPDLTPLAKNVSENIDNLVAIALRIQNQSNADEIVKEEMPKACHEGNLYVS